MPQSRSRSRKGRGVKVSNKPRKRIIKKEKKILKLTGKTLTELQVIARSHGIPFGGLSKTQLIDKILIYQ